MTIMISSSCHDLVNDIFGGARHSNRNMSFHKGSATIRMGTKLFTNGKNNGQIAEKKKDLELKSKASDVLGNTVATKNKGHSDGVLDHGNGTAMYDMYFEWIPQPIRFLLSASIGNIAFFALDHYLFTNIFIGKDTASFFVAYLIQILLQHSLNAYLVYGYQTISTRLKYMKTLTSTYSAYFGSLVASTAFNSLLIRYTPISKNVAFWTTITIFGFVNFFLLGKLVEDSSDCAQHNGLVSPSSSQKINNANKITFMKNRGGATSSTSIVDSVQAMFHEVNIQQLSSLILSFFLPHQSFNNINSVSSRGQF